MTYVVNVPAVQTERYLMCKEVRHGNMHTIDTNHPDPSEATEITSKSPPGPACLNCERRV